MSKFTLGQRQFPTLGLRSQQPKNYVGQTLSCYLGNPECRFSGNGFQIKHVIVYFFNIPYEWKSTESYDSFDR